MFSLLTSPSSRADIISTDTEASTQSGQVKTLIQYGTSECSFGSVLVASSERGICAILLGDNSEALLEEAQRRFPKTQLIDSGQEIQNVLAEVVGFLKAPGARWSLPLDVQGTAFQQSVWAALLEIPSGSTTTYTQIATQIGRPQSIRAVAQACAANPIAVAIPCHRVLRRDGSLAGYRWGVERKRALLARESGSSNAAV